MKQLILIVGPSGSGKDTLLRWAREYFRGWKGVTFCKRYITRVPDENEDNFYVCEKGFETLEHSNFFAFSWKAYNYFYGIPSYEIKEGYCNFISVSRSMVNKIECMFSHVVTIYIRARKDIIKKRLLKRKREPVEIIKERLKRYDIDIMARNRIDFINEGEERVVRENFLALCRSIINDFFYKKKGIT